MSNADDNYILTSAPSKFILCGEYAVIYEKHAVAMALDFRTRVKITKNNSQRIKLNLKSFNQTREWPLIEIRHDYRLVSKANDIWTYDGWPSSINYLLYERYITKHTAENPDVDISADAERAKMATDATKVFLLLYLAIGDSYRNTSRIAVDVEVDSDTIPGSGIGSSSSFSVALAGALLRSYRVMAEPHIIERWAFNAEKYFHGRPSGVDTSAVTYGGCILFYNTRTRHRDKANLFKVLIIDSGVRRSTKDMVSKVHQRKTRQPDQINDILHQIDECSSNIWRLIDEGAYTINYNEFKRIIDTNQQLLESLQVGHPKLTEIIECCQRYGLASKLTGAGGGGFAYAIYLDEHKELVRGLKNELETLGFKFYDVEASVPGYQQVDKNFHEKMNIM